VAIKKLIQQRHPLAPINGPIFLSSVSRWPVPAKLRLLTPPSIVARNLKGPEGIAIEANGSLLIVESLAARLSRANPQSGVVSSAAENLELGSPQLMGISFGTFDGVTVGPSGAIYVGGDKANVVYRIQ